MNIYEGFGQEYQDFQNEKAEFTKNIELTLEKNKNLCFRIGFRERVPTSVLMELNKSNLLLENVIERVYGVDVQNRQDFYKLKFFVTTYLENISRCLSEIVNAQDELQKYKIEHDLGAPMEEESVRARINYLNSHISNYAKVMVAINNDLKKTLEAQQ